MFRGEWKEGRIIFFLASLLASSHFVSLIIIDVLFFLNYVFIWFILIVLLCMVFSSMQSKSCTKGSDTINLCHELLLCYPLYFTLVLYIFWELLDPCWEQKFSRLFLSFSLRLPFCISKYKLSYWTEFILPLNQLFT